MKKIVVGTFFVLLIIPQITSAAWWNPFTWLARNPAPIVQEVTPSNRTEVKKNYTFTNTPTPPSIKKKIETPKPVVKKITKEAPTPAPTATPVKIQKNEQQICEDTFGTSVVYSGQKNANGSPVCDCLSGYKWNSNQTSCVVVPVKTGYQICSDAFPNGTWNGTYNSDGKYNCVCISGYQWNDSRKSCEVYSAPAYAPYPTMPQYTPSAPSASSQFYNLCMGVEDDIRHEIQAGNGFANEAQIQGLVRNRKQKLGCYNGTIPTAICNDYTPTYSTDRQGSCSYHGGVMFFY